MFLASHPWHRKLFDLTIIGAVVGAVLAFTAPPTRAQAGCKCDDWSTGSYQCNMAQTQCLAGSEICMVVCTD